MNSLSKLFIKNNKIKKKEITSKTDEFSADSLHKELLTKWIYYSKMIESSINVNKDDIIKARNLLTEVDIEIKKLISLNLESTRQCRELKKKSSELNKDLNKLEYLSNVSGYCRNLNLYLPGSILIPFSEYKKILGRYGLCSGKLNDYLGTIPNEVMKSIERFSSLYNEVYRYKLNCNLFKMSSLGEGFDKPYYYIDNVEFYYDTSSKYRNEIMNLINIFPISDSDREYDYLDYIKANKYDSISEINFSRIHSNQLLISCPREYLKGVEYSIKSKIIDPIIFFLCPYGVVAIDMFDDPESGELNTSLINKITESRYKLELPYSFDKIQE